MDHSRLFAAETAPALILLDAGGRRHPVASADFAAKAIGAANILQSVGGTGREKINPPACGKEPEEMFLLFYSSGRGRPTKGEIARAAKVIARSEVRLHEGEENEQRVTGTRALVFPERPAAQTGQVVFLVSTQVWFNRNRSTLNFPAREEEFEAMLSDINARLDEGRVSIVR